MSAPDGMNDDRRTENDTAVNWDGRDLLAELAAAREEIKHLRRAGGGDDYRLRQVAEARERMHTAEGERDEARRRDHDLREEALAQEANLWNIITHARTWIPTNRRAAYREAYRAKFKTVARSASSPAATEDEACTYCGATPDGATTPGCPVCEGVIETPAATEGPE